MEHFLRPLLEAILRQLFGLSNVVFQVLFGLSNFVFVEKQWAASHTADQLLPNMCPIHVEWVQG